MKIFPLAAIVTLGMLPSVSTLADTKKPNIIIFLADDMGYSDLGCFGSEIQTPNLDSLARHGIKYTQFYNTARCWPSRAAILTGYYAQQVRRDTVPGVVPNGMSGVRPEWAKLLPAYLRQVGYTSYHSGKWHIDGKPLNNGFDHSYWLADTDRHFAPNEHYLDDKRLPAVQPGTGYYSTTAITSHAIQCIENHVATKPDVPFFSYVAYICPHFPVMAPSEDIAKYKHRFDAGWDKMRVERQTRIKQLGIIDCELSSRTPGVPAWDTLDKSDQAQWSDRMAVHAAMVDRMDQEIGRVMETLKTKKLLENTVVLFLSDNGASAEKVLRGDGNKPGAAPGSADTFMCIEKGWANLANAPLRLSKIFVHEGGISTPLIVSWQGHIPENVNRNQPAHIIDITPTILQLAGAQLPVMSNAPKSPGVSLLQTFKNKNAKPNNELWWYHEGNRAIRVGDYKLVAQGAKGPWELYNIKKDRAEMHDLSVDMPDKARELSELWQKRLDEFTQDAQKK